jgi:molybdopterin-guanine dinucleotide biosynthesis protein A
MTDRNNAISIPGMLMIGAAGRDAGKTYFACKMMRRFAGSRDIVGIKVTPIERVTERCPHGRDDCNVCASLKGKFEIVEETDPAPDKDTCKLLAAGAKRVFWLRVLKSHLKEGAAALLETIGKDAVCICESNSLRNVVEPGLFLMLKNSNTDDVKPSSKAVAQHADRLVLFDGNSFDIDCDDFALSKTGWTMKTQATAIIMAGGESRRMGHDKSMLCVEGKPMIQHICEQLRPWFDEILISANDSGKYGFLGVPVIGDREPRQGPLMGIASAMEISTNDANFVIACDMPEIDTSLMLRMLRQSAGYDGVVPRITESRYEPLFAVYRKNMLPVINDLLASGERKVDRSYDLCKIRYVDLGTDSFLRNINTVQDYLGLDSGEKDVAV